MTNQDYSQKHWLEPVLSRELAGVEAPESLRAAVFQAQRETSVMGWKFAWVGAALAAGVFGVMVHTYTTQSFAERGTASAAVNRFSQNAQVRSGVKAAQFSGACHLCHSDL